MIKIFEIVKKNFLLLVRSKTSALIVLFGPLILMLLIGFAFNTSSLYDIKVGTYSSGYSELSNSVVDKLKDDKFIVLKMESEESCIDKIRSGDIHVCTIFPANLNVKSSDKITFYVDKSRLNFVYIILDRISSQIATKSTELSTALTNRLLSSINNANEKLDTSKKISGDLESVKGDLGKIDATYTVANFSDLRAEAKRVANISSTSDTKILSLIKDAETNYNGISSKLDTISTSVKTVTTTLGGNINTAKELETSIKTVKDDINSIEIKDVSRIVSPISTEIKPISAESTNLSYTFPTLVLLVILFAGLFLGSTSVMEEKTSKAYFRNFITPTKDILFVISQYLSNVMIILLQLLIIFAVMLLITKASLSATLLLNVFIILFLTGSVFILLGMVIGYLFKSSETANLGAISLGALSLFFSNTILPIETLPGTLREIVQFNPFILGETSLKKIILFNENLSGVWLQVAILFAFVVFLFFAAYYTRELTKRQIS